MIERSPHDIRRTYISNLLDAGVDLKKVMDYAGHQQSSTTLKYYAYAVRMSEELAEQVANALPY